MGNIFGEGFNPIISKQIDIRQQKYGSGFSSYKKDEDHSYLTSTTSWCKLVSASDLRISSNLLAKKYVLHNGITDFSSGGYPNKERAGVDNLNNSSYYLDTEVDIINAGAYGIGGTLHSGLAPMPGIISADIVHENRGSLRRAEVKIRAFNQEQFNIIDVLYLRLGFSILLEWGHSSYLSYEKNGEIKFNPSNEYSLTTEFLEGKYTYSGFLLKIQQYRLLSQGNYDAMFGRVANFSWSFLKDGTYDITLKLVSIGDVIESLKLNTVTGVELSSPEPPDPDAPNLDIIKTYSVANSIGRWLALGADPSASISTPPSANSGINPNINPNLDINIPGLTEALEQATNFNNFTTAAWKNIAQKNTIKINYDSDLKDQYYVRLGALLNFIQTGTNSIPAIIPTVFNKNGAEALLRFDPDGENTIMYIDKLQISVDPRVCFIKKNVPTNLGDLDFKDDDDKAEEIIRPDSYAKIYNIYVNDVYIINTIKSNMNSEGTISLYSFLKNILDGISLALGGVNKLDLIIDETTNVIYIVDNNPLPGKEKFLGVKNPTIFNLYGFKQMKKTDGDNPFTSVGSLVKDFNFQTEISNDLATMITVAAQYNGNVPGENPAAFSALNAGITDRYKTSISVRRNGSNLEEEKNAFDQMLEEYALFLQRLSNKTATIAEVEANVGKYKDILQTYDNLKKIGAISKNVKPLTEKEKFDLNYPTKINWGPIEYDPISRKEYVSVINPIRTIETALLPTFTAVESNFTGFIPFNLQLTIDGLSGMKCIQRFLVDGDYLPRNYPNVVEFLIKGIQHQIIGNKWYTKLESYCISKGPGVSNTPIPTISNLSGGGGGGGANPTVIIPTPPSSPPPGGIYLNQWTTEIEDFSNPNRPAGNWIVDGVDVWDAVGGLRGTGDRTNGWDGLLTKNYQHPRNGLGRAGININEYKTYKHDSRVYWAVRDLDNARNIAQSSNANVNVQGASVSKAVVAAHYFDKFSNTDGVLPNNRDYWYVVTALIPSNNNSWNTMQTAIDPRKLLTNDWSNSKGYNNMEPAKNTNRINAVGMNMFWDDISRNKLKGSGVIAKSCLGGSTHTARSQFYIPSEYYVGTKTGTWSPWKHDSGFVGKPGSKWFAITVLQSYSYSGGNHVVATMWGGLFREYYLNDSSWQVG